MKNLFKLYKKKKAIEKIEKLYSLSNQGKDISLAEIRKAHLNLKKAN